MLETRVSYTFLFGQTCTFVTADGKTLGPFGFKQYYTRRQGQREEGVVLSHTPLRLSSYLLVVKFGCYEHFVKSVR